MKKKNKTIIPHVLVGDMVAEGKCIARIDNKVYFIENALPGDVVDLRIVKDKKSYAECVPVHFHERSPFRQEAFCKHFGTCGGCKWQDLSYDQQLKFKQQEVADALAHIGKVEIPPLLPIIGSEKTRYYRNKLEYTFSNRRWLTKEDINSETQIERSALGFHIPKQFDKIMHVEECHLQPEPSNAIRNAVFDYGLKNGMSFNDKQFPSSTFLRNLIIRTANTGQVMVIFQVYHMHEEWLFGTLEMLKQQFPSITSLNYVINPKGNETFFDLEIVNYHGLPYIEETMEGLSFRVGPKSFYQTNSDQAYQLYKVTRELAGLTGEELVYDLYTGTGTIANFVARQAKHVVGIEYVEMAIEDARINSSINGISNTTFYAGDMKDILTTALVEQHGQPDVVITDPPRSGMHEKVVEQLILMQPRLIVYVSCKPSTQARDIAMLSPYYTVTAVQPVDMFPHTYHVENVVLLEKR